MKITKTYTTETSHRVPGASTTRCRGIHGHSYKFEVSLQGSPINNACMVLDFAELKDTIRPLIDAFDHTHLICEHDDPEYVAFIKKTSDRWISAPFNWSCEMMSLLVLYLGQRILDAGIFSNGEVPEICEVKVWETATGSCTSTLEDLKYFNENWIKNIRFSQSISDELPEVIKQIIYGSHDKLYKTTQVDKYMKMPGINIM